MKALTDRLEWLRLSILDDKTGITDPQARQMAMDMLIEANAIAEALPEITITIPQPPPGQRKVSVNANKGRAEPAVSNGGRTG